MQNGLFEIKQNQEQPTKNHKHKSYAKPDKIWQNIREWNTIEGIELYKPLYDLCSQLFMLTYSNKLACLNYYIDIEVDESKTYTVMYAEIPDIWHLSLKERYNQHKQLLQRVLNNDPTLEYDEKVIDSETLTLFNYQTIYN